MEDNLIQILETLGFPVFRQGSMSDEEVYPSTFLTFWNNNSPNHAHYNNNEYGTDWDFNIFVYSEDPSKTYSVLLEARNALKEAGWITPSKGFDVASDEATHTGRGLEVFYLET
jgi:hypothetical protein